MTNCTYEGKSLEMFLCENQNKQAFLDCGQAITDGCLSGFHNSRD